MDEARVQEFVGQTVGYMTGGAMCFSIWVGDQLGFYRAMAGAGPMSADALAANTGCNSRLTREWLDAQAAAGLVDYQRPDDSYELGEEGAMALADDNSPVFVARAMNAMGSFFMDIDKVTAAFRGNGGLRWGDHHPYLFSGTEWFFRTGYRAYLPSAWIPALDVSRPSSRPGPRSPISAVATAPP